LRCALAAVADARAVGAGGAEAAALVSLGTLADSAGDVELARERLREAERKARDSGALNGELRALHFLGLSYDDRAEIRSALKYYAKGIQRAKETGLTWSSFGIELRTKHLTLRYVSGDWPEDDDAGRAGRGVSSVVAGRFLGIWAQFVVGRGRFADADKILPSLRQHWSADYSIALASADAAIQLASWRKDYAGAVRQARELIDWLEEVEPAVLGGIRISVHGLAAAVAQAAEARVRGDLATAEAAVEAGEKLLAHGRHCAEHGIPRSVSLGPEALAWLARLEALGACLRGAGDPALWAKAVEAFGYGAVYEQAMCRLQHAKSLLASDGDTALAASELLAAHAVADRLGACPLREAVRELSHRARVELPGEAVAPRRDVVDPLTDRERDVLERVALGRTNRQVGEELYISEKTVSVHLSRVMAKLGASRRAEAVAIAYDRGLLAAPTSSS
ncbi:helix-turn-helix transcriptional regulator, partial [Amycolatopsis sp. MJM2582]|uniref:helix-turn-helix transcriptional regulator n=1 Tax=Amycolatopsis sp. MJM2582 TaxID=1427749 RepID=UPI00056A9029